MIKLMKALSPRWMSLLFLTELFNLNLEPDPCPGGPVLVYPCTPLHHQPCFTTLDVVSPFISQVLIGKHSQHRWDIWRFYEVVFVSSTSHIIDFWRKSSSWLNATVATDFYSHHLSLCLTVQSWQSHFECNTVPMKDCFVSRVIIAWNIWPLRGRNKSALILVHQICAVLTVDIVALFLQTIVIYLN